MTLVPCSAYCYTFQDNLCAFIRTDKRIVATLIDEDEVISVPFDTRMLARHKLSGNLEIILFTTTENHERLAGRIYSRS